MPKATLEFSLPEELSEFNTSLKGGAYFSALFHFSERLRQLRKHRDDLDTTTLNVVSDELLMALVDHGVELDE